MPSPPWIHAAWAIPAIPAGLWCIFVALGSTAFFQRHFLYAHKVSPFWQDANNPEKWGFARNQVTPFSLDTEDGETIYAWHVLPLRVYATHESRLAAQPSGFRQDFTSTENFKLLRDDPEAKVIIYLHGNAGHLPNAIRAPSFHTFTDTSSYHLLAIDYRGFGRSTGSPTEAGLVTDASSAVEFAMHLAGVAPDRILLLGQSLGTAVAAAVAERYAIRGVDFAGVILVAGFSDLPTMLSGYAIAGWVPVLRPLTYCPPLLRAMTRFIVDKWPSAERLGQLVKAVKARNGRLRLSLVHAQNDWDIPCHEDDRLFASAARGLFEGVDVDDQRLLEMKDERTTGRGKDAFVSEWREGRILIRQELYPYGGHNDVMLYAPVVLEVLRSFEPEDTFELSAR